MLGSQKSLKELLLIHELAFVILVTLTGVAGGIGIRMWDKASHESQRINLLVQEIQQARGDLYRQMKEVFDAYFLADEDAEREYQGYTVSMQQHFSKLQKLTIGSAEQTAIKELHQSYEAFVAETSTVFSRRHSFTDASIEKALNSDLESNIFQRYEYVSARAEKLLAVKQKELQIKLDDAKRISVTLLTIPVILATLLLLFSRIFLKRAIVQPIKALLHATTEISAGRLEHKAPEEGAAELVTLSSAINNMAEQLARSQEELIRTEKQAAQGLLVPMLAHNIRNPLASIRATAQVADSSELDQETRDSFLDIIAAVDRLERWTGSLLAYLHPLRPHANATTLRLIINGALMPLQQKLREKNIEIELPAWEKHDDSMFTDEHLLEQALYNLLLNAVEAIPINSKLEIHADIEQDSLRIMIADRGPGMPFTPDPHALSAGPTTKRFGTGLGIPFAFKVCEVLEGSIQFRKRESGGTLIEIELPRRHEENLISS